MKIRSGFVTNSSSTSFLIITKEELDKESFFDLIGVSLDSPIADLFEGLYQAVTTNDSYGLSADAISDKELFGGRVTLTDYMLDKIKAAHGKGVKIYYGFMSNEKNNFEPFFCTDSFEIENDTIYFNGLNCVW